MNTSRYHVALLDKLAEQPNLITLAARRTPDLARRAYHRQLEFMAALYGVTTSQLEHLLRRQYA